MQYISIVKLKKKTGDAMSSAVCLHPGTASTFSSKRIKCEICTPSLTGSHRVFYAPAREGKNYPYELFLNFNHV